MAPLTHVPIINSNATINQMREIVNRTNVDFVAIYYREFSHIVGIAFPRDLLRIPENKRVRDYAKPPWFVMENTPITQILQQFQRNNESVAVILDKQGRAEGLLTLEDLLREIFGEARYKPAKEKSVFFMERTFAGSTKVGDFNKQFGTILDEDTEITLSQLMTKVLTHPPEEGDAIYIGPFELNAKETSLLEVKTILVKSRST